MAKILLVLTGGTIGSFDNNGVISSKAGTCRVLQLFLQKNPHEAIEFVIEEPYNILSENLDTVKMEVLVNFLLSYDIKGFDGVIVTHGSDTLSYTSAMLGICLAGFAVPVVITAADYVPDDMRSNALVNFTAAVKLIQKVKSGIYTVYKNSCSPCAQIFIPTRLREADRISDIFTSYDGSPLGEIDNSGNIREYGGKISISELENSTGGLIDKPVSLKRRVGLIFPYPSVDYDNMNIDGSTGALLHVTYHSGTVPEKAAVLLGKCKEMGIPLYLCSFKSAALSLYETSFTISGQGALPLYDIGTESAYAKLLLAVNEFPDDIGSIMKKDIYFESCGKN